MLGLRWFRAMVHVGALAGSLGACAAHSAAEDAAADVFRNPFLTRDAGVLGFDVGWGAADGTTFDALPAVDITPIEAGYPADAPTSPTYDAASSPCALLEEAYAASVHDAEVCTMDGDCTALACETLCCVCQVYVNPSTATFGSLASIREEWVANGCAAHQVCSAMACPRPVGAACSSVHRCSTFPR